MQRSRVVSSDSIHPQRLFSRRPIPEAFRIGQSVDWSPEFLKGTAPGSPLGFPSSPNTNSISPERLEPDSPDSPSPPSPTLRIKTRCLARKPIPDFSTALSAKEGTTSQLDLIDSVPCPLFMERGLSASSDSSSGSSSILEKASPGAITPITSPDDSLILPSRTHSRALSDIASPSKLGRTQNGRRLRRASKPKEGDMRKEFTVEHGNSELRAQDGQATEHRRATSDFLDIHKAQGRSPAKTPTGGWSKEDPDGDVEEAIAAALIRFQWVPDNAGSSGPLHPALLRINIPSDDGVEMLKSPASDSEIVPSTSETVKERQQYRKTVVETKLRDVFTDDGSQNKNASAQAPAQPKSSDSPKQTDPLPSITSVDSLNLLHYEFPPPPRLLNERHSHGSLRSLGGFTTRSMLSPPEPSPPKSTIGPIDAAPSVPGRSPLRERRAKPPIHIVLERKSTSSLSGRKMSLPILDGDKGSPATSVFSPPPCPPPSAPLPDLPTPSSEDGPSSATYRRHRPSVSAVPTFSRRSFHSSEASQPGPPSSAALQLRKRPFLKSTSNPSSTIVSPLSASSSPKSRTVPLDTPPQSSNKPGFSPTAAIPFQPISNFTRVESDDYFRALEDAFTPPPSARTSKGTVSSKAKLDDLVQCLSPSSDSFTPRCFMLDGDAGIRKAVSRDQNQQPPPSVKNNVRPAFPHDMPVGVECEDQIVYGLAL